MDTQVSNVQIAEAVKAKYVEKDAMVDAKAEKAVVPAKKNINPISAMLTSEKVQVNIAKVLPKDVDVARFFALAMNQFVKNPTLKNCTRESFYNCLITSARVGIVPDGRNAYLIPYKDECTLQFDYKGLGEMLIRNGIIKAYHAEVIKENDTFSHNMGEVVEHTWDIRKEGERGEVVGAWASVTLPSGLKQYRILGRSDIDKVKNHARSGNVWREWFDEMAKKTVLKNLFKTLSMTPCVQDAMDEDNKGTVLEAQTHEVHGAVSNTLAIPAKAETKEEDKPEALPF